jgi:hypothetical protein
MNTKNENNLVMLRNIPDITSKNKLIINGISSNISDKLFL